VSDGVSARVPGYSDECINECVSEKASENMYMNE
jgi:hypothetical protein